jgi:hypothetical protein
MFSTDQSHLRKYLATLGIAVAAGTLSLAGLFMRLQQDLLVTQPTLARLTSTARVALLQRQRYLAFGTSLLPFFVAIGFSGGLALASYGLVGWARRQQISDEREDIELRKGRAELLRMTDRERADKLDQEAKESAADISSALPPVERTSGTPITGDSTEQLISHFRVEVATVENALVQKLRAIFGKGEVTAAARVRRGRDERITVDAVARTPESHQLVVFEVKYAASKNTVMSRAVEGLMQVARAASLLDAKGALIVVVSDKATTQEIEVWSSRVNAIAGEYRSVTGVLISRYSEFLALPPEDLLEQLDAQPLVTSKPFRPVGASN